MKRIILAVLLVLLILPSSIVLAADISDARYSGTIRISNNGTDAFIVVLPVSGMNTTNYINNNFLNSDADNCAVYRSGSDIVFQPGRDDIPWMIFEPSILANTYRDDIFYTNATGGKIAYFPDSDGMTISDDPSMEISGNGTIYYNGYINTTSNGTNQYFMIKEGAYYGTVSPSESENISFNILGWNTPAGTAGTWTDTDNITDDNTSTYSNYSVNAGTWSPYIYATFASTSLSSFRYWVSGSVHFNNAEMDIYNGTSWFTAFAGDPAPRGEWVTRTFTLAENISQVRYRFYNNDVGLQEVRLNEVDINSPVDTVSASGVTSGEYEICANLINIPTINVTASLPAMAMYGYNDYESYGEVFYNFPVCTINRVDVYLDKIISPSGTGYLRIRDGDNNLLGVLGSVNVATVTGWTTFDTTPVSVPAVTDLRVTFDFSGSQLGIATENADIYSDGAHIRSTDLSTWETVTGYDLQFALFTDNNLSLCIDGEIKEIKTTSANITDSTDDLIIGGACTPYIIAANVTVNGTCGGSWAWEYDSTFTDLSGNGNDATPSFRTTTTDADVTAELLSLTPVSEADAPAFTMDDPTGWISTNTTASSNFTTTLTPTFPGADIITDAATAGETPAQVPILIISSVAMLGITLTSAHFMRKSNSISIFVTIIITVAGLGILVAVHVVDSWMFRLFLMIAIAIGMMSTRVGFAGTGATGNNLVGFLFMSFAGMTLINRILEGRFLQTSDINILSDVLVFQPFNVFGWFTIPVPNVSFLTHGIPAIMRWDYSYFGGDAQLIQYMLYSITAVLSFILFVLALGAAYNMFSRGR